MSGPVTSADTEPEPATTPPEPPGVEVTDGRAATVGDMPVVRVLPRRARRTVGAWCFVDQMGPAPVTEDRGIDVGPHPHIGLQTVTWLFAGEVLHRDSLGSEQLIRPGQLNLMTAGAGVAHSEEATGAYAGPLHGIQLWVAQPEVTRHGPAAFEHHASLPTIGLPGGTATVLVGELDGTASPARRDTDHVGIDLDLTAGRHVLPVQVGHEHALVIAAGRVAIDGQAVAPGQLAHLGPGRGELVLEASEAVRLLLLGGTPFPEPVLMWWNYVARTRDEIIDAHRDWTERAERFGSVASPLPAIDVGPPPWAPGRDAQGNR